MNGYAYPPKGTITVKKDPIPFTDGGPEKFLPSGDYKTELREYLKDPNDDPITVEEVTICVITQDGKKYFECELMSDNIVVPHVRCMFLVRIRYPWRIKTGRLDTDRILTDGENFYSVIRNLAECPFRLNEYSKDKLNSAITQYVGSI